MSVCDSKWNYINEGNVHIVLQIANTNKVLRLIKEDNEPLKLSSVINSIRYVNEIMIPIIFGDNNYQEEIKLLTSNEILKLSKDLEKWRPNHRKAKSKLSQYAIMAPNLAIINKNSDNYCLEIKPKEGFMPASLKKSPKCYYCLKQYLKLSNKDITHISDYCPLNLFSGNKEQMKHALLSLIQNPQNNLKLFKNGTIIFSDDSNLNNTQVFINKMFESLNTFLDFIITVLLSDRSHTILDKSSESNYIKPEKCYERHNLATGTFLEKLLSVQKLIDQYEGNTDDDTNGFEYVSQMLQTIDDNNFNLKNIRDRKNFLEKTNPRYLALISAVAKDCSIMISFTPQYEEGLPYIHMNGKNVYYRISLTDLEPKSVKTLKKRCESEKKLLERIQPQAETRAKQLEAWENFITDYYKTTKQSTIDIREVQNISIFKNESISRKLSQESLLVILEYMSKNEKAAPVDKSKNVWEVYWHSLDEWGNMVYDWASSNGLNNTVCTIFELREGENSVGEEFHGLDINVLMKALKILETRGKCEIMQFDDNQGVKFF